MAFGLKNAGAKYQWMAITLLYDMIHKEIEVYVDDMMVKSPTREGHFEALEKFLDRVKKYNLRLNPKKCIFRVTSRKFLSIIISKRGIKANPKKIHAVLDLPLPHMVKKIQSLADRIATLNQFVLRSVERCLPFFKVLYQPKDIQWSQDCQDSFQQLKAYLTSPPLLTSEMTLPT